MGCCDYRGKLAIEDWRRIVRRLFKFAIICGILDMFLTNYLCPLFINYYLLLVVPTIGIYFTINLVFTSIIAKLVIDKFWQRIIACGTIPLFLTLLYILSPIFVLIFISLCFTKWGRKTMLHEDHAPKIFGYMRDCNRFFRDIILNHIPKYNNNKYKNNNNLIWCNDYYLRSIFYCSIHLIALKKHVNVTSQRVQKNQTQKEKRKEYINLLIKFLKLSQNNKINNKLIKEMYHKYWCDKNFQYWNLHSPEYYFSFYKNILTISYLFIFFVHCVVFWSFFGITYYNSPSNHIVTDEYTKYKKTILYIWIIRDIIALILSIILITLYRGEVYTQIRCRFSWIDYKILLYFENIIGNNGLKLQLYESNLALSFLYDIIWIYYLQNNKLENIIENSNINNTNSLVSFGSDRREFKEISNIIIQYVNGFSFKDMQNENMWYKLLYADNDNCNQLTNRNNKLIMYDNCWKYNEWKKFKKLIKTKIKSKYIENLIKVIKKVEIYSKNCDSIFAVKLFQLLNQIKP